MIPRNLIQFWHDLDNAPGTILGALETTKANNPGYTSITASDAFMEEFLTVATFWAGWAGTAVVSGGSSWQPASSIVMVKSVARYRVNMVLSSIG